MDATAGEAVPLGGTDAVTVSTTVSVYDSTVVPVVVHGCQFGLLVSVMVTTAVYVTVVSVTVRVFVPSQYVRVEVP